MEQQIEAPNLNAILKRLAIFALLLVLTFALLVAVGLHGTRAANERQTRVFEQELRPAQLVADIYRLQLIQAIQMLELGSPIDAAGRKARAQFIGDLQKIIDRSAREYEAASLPESVKAVSARFLEQRKAYYVAFNEAMAYASKDDLANMGRVMETKARSPGLTMAKEVEEMNALMREANARSHTEAETATRKQTALELSLLVCTLVASAALGWWARSRLMRCMGADFSVLDRSLGRVAELDLRDADAPSVSAGSLLHTLQRMQRQLVQVVFRVRQNSDQVATASAEIAHGNRDLSMRTEQQAAAIQETAASMEQLGQTVRDNADNANLAKKLATSASAVAAQGGEVVSKVVVTMRGINDSSRQINDIIGVIEGIAFQTNILALNAAVEAARAGEQGRGFAVVAAEVRSLAQRSSQAAKEIKTLIVHSVQQVEGGTILVDQAGRTIGEIVSSVQRVSDIVAEIATASAEQSSGVRQIGEVLGQIDHATQQNAALVEQSAAAAESLKTQANELLQAVAGFKL